MGKTGDNQNWALLWILMIPFAPIIQLFTWLYERVKAQFGFSVKDSDSDYRDQGQDDISPPKPE